MSNEPNAPLIRIGLEDRDSEDRSRRYFGELYPRLQQYPVLVVGAGAVGCEVVKNLVMVGVREIHLVDFDKVSGSNLNRCVFFRPEDHGITYKVDAIAREVRSISPKTKITTYPVAIQDAPEEIWQVPLVMVAVDNNEARYYINLRAVSAPSPFFMINGALGRSFFEVQVLLPGHTACLVCSWTQQYFEKLFQNMVRQSCDQFFFKSIERFPAISVLNSLTGGMMASEAIKVLVGLPRWQEQKCWEEEHVPLLGQSLRYDLCHQEFSIGAVLPNPQCVEVFCRSQRHPRACEKVENGTKS